MFLFFRSRKCSFCEENILTALLEILSEKYEWNSIPYKPSPCYIALNSKVLHSFKNKCKQSVWVLCRFYFSILLFTWWVELNR